MADIAPREKNPHGRSGVVRGRFNQMPVSFQEFCKHVFAKRGLPVPTDVHLDLAKMQRAGAGKNVKVREEIAVVCGDIADRVEKESSLIHRPWEVR